MIARFLELGLGLDRLMHREEMLEDSGNGSHALSFEDAGGGGSLADDKVLVRSQGSTTASDASEGQQIGTAPDRSPEEAPKSRPRKDGNGPPSGKPAAITYLVRIFI